MDKWLEELKRNKEDDLKVAEYAGVTLTSEEYKRLIQQAERVQELEESEKWLVKIREMICDEDYSPGVLEYAVSCPEGMYDMVKELYDHFQKLEEQLYESEESTYQIQIQFLEKNRDYNQAEKEKQRYEECLKSVQEELHYALNTDKDYDIKWYYVVYAKRFIDEALKGESE